VVERGRGGRSLKESLHLILCEKRKERVRKESLTSDPIFYLMGLGGEKKGPIKREEKTQGKTRHLSPFLEGRGEEKGEQSTFGDGLNFIISF